jgi:hypothetical protein
MTILRKYLDEYNIFRVLVVLSKEKRIISKNIYSRYAFATFAN